MKNIINLVLMYQQTFNAIDDKDIKYAFNFSNNFQPLVWSKIPFVDRLNK